MDVQISHRVPDQKTFPYACGEMMDFHFHFVIERNDRMHAFKCGIFLRSHGVLHSPLLNRRRHTDGDGWSWPERSGREAGPSYGFPSSSTDAISTFADCAA